MSASVGGWSWTNQEKRTPMTEMKHTKEPWYVSEYLEPNGGRSHFQLEGDSGGFIFFGRRADHDRVEQCVNAMGGFVRVDFKDEDGDACYKWEKRGERIPNPPAFVEAAMTLAEIVDDIVRANDMTYVASGVQMLPNGPRQDMVDALSEFRKHLPAEGDKR